MSDCLLKSILWGWRSVDTREWDGMGLCVCWGGGGEGRGFGGGRGRGGKGKGQGQTGRGCRDGGGGGEEGGREEGVGGEAFSWCIDGVCGELPSDGERVKKTHTTVHRSDHAMFVQFYGFI